MISVSVPRPNFYLSSEGFSVEILGRTGLRYCDRDRQMFIDSEVLMPPAGIAVYKDSIRSWQSPYADQVVEEDERQRIVRNIIDTLGSQGVDVQVI